MVDQTPNDEYVPLQIPNEYRRMAVEEEKWTVRELWNRYQQGDIVLEPDFQRHYVWDDTRASRYIESLILNLPTRPSSFQRKMTDVGL